MISTTFGWHLPRSHSGIAPDNTRFISRTTNRFKFSPLESITKQRRSVTEDPRHFRKPRHIPNLEQMTIEVALGRVELKRKRKSQPNLVPRSHSVLQTQPWAKFFFQTFFFLFFFSMILASVWAKRAHETDRVAREKCLFSLFPTPTPAQKRKTFLNAVVHATRKYNWLVPL